MVIGAGSIGKRHALNLLSIGKEVSIFDVDREKVYQLATKEGFSIVEELTSQTMQQFGVVFVCTPSHLHLESTKLALEAGCSVFIEKPIAIRVTPELEEIGRLAKDKGNSVLVGCNLRFHDAIKELKRMIGSGELGKVYSAHVYFGQFLPSWRTVDYRQTYSAKADLGGGMLLEGIHEFDYLCWLFGEVEEVYASTSKSSDLEIDAEDLAEVILKFKNGIIGHIHIDCLQKTKRRGYEVVGEKKTIIWESIGNSPEKAVIKILGLPAELIDRKELIIDPNSMYVEEIRYFLNSIDHHQGRERDEKAKTMNDITQAVSVLRVVEAAKLSAKLKKAINLVKK